VARRPMLSPLAPSSPKTCTGAQTRRQDGPERLPYDPAYNETAPRQVPLKLARRSPGTSPNFGPRALRHMQGASPDSQTCARVPPKRGRAPLPRDLYSPNRSPIPSLVAHLCPRQGVVPNPRPPCVSFPRLPFSVSSLSSRPVLSVILLTPTGAPGRPEISSPSAAVGVGGGESAWRKTITPRGKNQDRARAPRNHSTPAFDKDGGGNAVSLPAVHRRTTSAKTQSSVVTDDHAMRRGDNSATPLHWN